MPCTGDSLERLQGKGIRRWLQADLSRHIKSQRRWYHIERDFYKQRHSGGSTIGAPDGFKVDTGEVELPVVSAYASQVGCSEEEKACFWEDLEQYVQSLEGEEVLLIGGDFNGHVGSRKDGFESCHAGYGYGARNDDGLRILEYAVASDLIIANMQCRKRKSHLITYTSGRETQIDF
ncbi:hypothetical protein RB195_018676 [Necator americanus]|uniref:Endonuclease/exonuclease/phosphatase domain-containing protein n=1 Tax=Necator americanus TaxID=51031 RepID=A0ABR1CAT7_NECAM